MRRPLVEALHRNGVVFINGQLTFTPRGGTPLTSKVEIEVGVAGRYRRSSDPRSEPGDRNRP
jgi:hypothetical protein